MRMKHEPIVRAKRRPTNVTLSEPLIAEARELGINVSKACESGLAFAVQQEGERRWKAENAAWITAHREWVEANELPLERYRLF